LIASTVAAQATVSFVLGQLERELTGDGKPEILRVIGTGPTSDNLTATFTIESDARTVYRFTLAPLSRTVGFDAGRQVISEEQYRARLQEFGQWFFAKEKFQRPAEFVDHLRKTASGRVAEIPSVITRDRPASEVRDGAAIWREILESSATIFTFSPGGDAIVAIGWSATARRFYRLLECC
jgi:hypothetical protein